MTEVLIEHPVCIIGRYSRHFPSQTRFPFLCVEEFYPCLFETLHDQDRPCKQPPHNHRRRAISVSAEKEQFKTQSN